MAIFVFNIHLNSILKEFSLWLSYKNVSSEYWKVIDKHTLYVLPFFKISASSKVEYI